MPWKQLVGAVSLLFVASCSTPKPEPVGPFAPPPGVFLEREDPDVEPLSERRARQIASVKARRLESKVDLKERNQDLFRELQGAWQLVDYSSTVLPTPGRVELAYLLTAGEFFSIEFHMAYLNDQNYPGTIMMQTGTYRLEFNDSSQLLATLLIGSVNQSSLSSAPKQPGAVTVYEVDFNRGTLSLTTEDFSRFRFERVKADSLTESLYGNAEEQASEETPDESEEASEEVESAPTEEEPEDDESSGS
ncbi:MAG: hypothetical protein ACI8X5_003828 [Planctomycetota bacterium]|jgi:hypothetical protein